MTRPLILGICIGSLVTLVALRLVAGLVYRDPGEPVGELSGAEYEVTGIGS